MGQTVPQLIAELRQRIERKTGRPIDADIDRITTQIEMRSYAEPIANEWAGIGLTASERRLLDHLAGRPERTFSKEALATALYFDRPDDSPDVKIVDVLICKVRCKLVAADADVWVETNWGAGYRFVRTNARAARQALIDKHNNTVRQPKELRSPEWRFGIHMGRKQARIAECLFQNLGKWIRMTALSQLSGATAGSISAQITWMRRSMADCAYTIEHDPHQGYRMTAAPRNAKRAA